jgi:hypothetical protein
MDANTVINIVNSITPEQGKIILVLAFIVFLFVMFVSTKAFTHGH